VLENSTENKVLKKIFKSLTIDSKESIDSTNEMQRIILYVYIHACSPSYNNEEIKTFQSIQKVTETVCLWLVNRYLNVTFWEKLLAKVLSKEEIKKYTVSDIKLILSNWYKSKGTVIGKATDELRMGSQVKLLN